MSHKYRAMVSKGDLMREVFSPEENGSIDSATPIHTWKEFPPIDHVMSYCEPHTYGKLLNIHEEAKKRGIKLIHQPKIYFKEFENLEYIFEHLESVAHISGDPGTHMQYINHLKELIEFENLRKTEDQC